VRGYPPQRCGDPRLPERASSRRLPLATEADDVAAAVRATRRTLAGRLPLLTCFMTAERAPTVLHLDVRPDEAAATIARALDAGAAAA